MLNFQHLEKSKIKEYESYYSDPNAVGLEYNFVSAYLWSREYDIKVAFYDDTMIKAYRGRKGEKRESLLRLPLPKGARRA